MTIKQIFDEISSVSGDKDKISILAKHKDNSLLRRVLYLCKSKRVKFYIKQIPEYTPNGGNSLDMAIIALEALSSRKSTGSDAIRLLKSILTSLTSDDAYIIERIIEKDPKIGMGITYINEALGDLIEETPYMGAVSFDEKKARAIFNNGKTGLSQIKMDGRYCNAIIRNGDVELESRAGEPTVVTGALFLKELEKFSDCVLNGELTMDGVPRTESNGMITSIIDICSKREARGEANTLKKLAAFEKKHGSFEERLNNIRYTVWDVITIEEYFAKHSKVGYSTRLQNAVEIIGESRATMVSPINSRPVNSYAEAMEHFQEIIATEVHGVPLEGTILKAFDGEWVDGKPVHQIKMKLEMDVDLFVTGFNYGNKGTKNEFVISSFNASSSDGLVNTKPQGLKEDKMREVTDNQEMYLGKVIQTRCNGLSKDKDGNYSLLNPRFIIERFDKTTADSLASIMEIENMCKGLSKN